VLEDMCEWEEQTGQMIPQDDGIEILYISNVSPKSNLLRFHSYTVLNVETPLHKLQQQAAKGSNPMRRVRKGGESVRTEGEGAEVSMVVSERKSRRPKVSTRRTVRRRALILKDNSASHNFISSSYLDQLRKMDGVVIMTKNAGRMKVSTATGKEVHQKVLADLQIRIGTYTYRAWFTVFDVADYDIVVGKQWMVDINLRHAIDHRTNVIWIWEGTEKNDPLHILTGIHIPVDQLSTLLAQIKEEAAAEGIDLSFGYKAAGEEVTGEGAFWVDIRRVEAQVESLIPRKQQRGMGRRKLIRLEQRMRDALQQEKAESQHGHEKSNTQHVHDAHHGHEKPDAQHVHAPEAQQLIDDHDAHHGHEKPDAQHVHAPEAQQLIDDHDAHHGHEKPDAQHVHEPEAQQLIDDNLVVAAYILCPFLCYFFPLSFT